MTAAMLPPHRSGNGRDRMPEIIVHRPGQGFEGRCAPCLAEAYARTIAFAPDGVELDVRVTADGVPLAAHDATTRLLSRLPRPLGAIRHADLPPGKFLRLDELMPVFSEFAGRVYIEIKDTGARQVARVLEVLEPFRSRVWFISLPWNRLALRHVLERWREARTNQILIHPAQAHVARARDAGVGAVTLGWTRINPFRVMEPFGGVRRLIDAARGAGLEVGAGLANSAADLAWATRLGFETVWVDLHALERARAPTV